jgi:hypothetical protein
MLLLALDDVRVRTESVDCPWSVPIIRADNSVQVLCGQFCTGTVRTILPRYCFFLAFPYSFTLGFIVVSTTRSR